VRGEEEVEVLACLREGRDVFWSGEVARYVEKEFVGESRERHCALGKSG